MQWKRPAHAADDADRQPFAVAPSKILFVGLSGETRWFVELFLKAQG
jgi:hypothetical protein